MEEEIVPLTGKPFFAIIASKSKVGPRYYQLKVAANIRKILPKATIPVTLLYRNKRWEMTYKGCASFQGLCFHGWKKFVLDNEIKLGEGIVFELVNSEDVEFKVQILRESDPGN